ncbi:hypothetical protein, partial [Selenomonas ruminantium]|uniref:hypothetical protein n=1 Tax=Selenomonas ruminantium TaxID=971 RepID=UPI0026EEC8B9
MFVEMTLLWVYTVPCGLDRFGLSFPQDKVGRIFSSILGGGIVMGIFKFRACLCAGLTAAMLS